ncbi:MAG: hypothetical protein RLZZ558_1519 [Planctomycetota bacterium]|jgi:hypothetical protein
MSNKKAILLIAAGLLAVGAVFVIVLFTAGTPRGMEPPVDEAPSPN